jgi:hypothetical protein
MIRPVLSSFCALAIVLATACDKKPDAPAATDAATTATASAAPATSAAAGDAGAKHEMNNCPTAVAGATVAIKDVEGGVEVSVTGKDDAATKEIRDRAKRLASADRNEKTDGKHTGGGTGGGNTGHCTIIMRHTTLETAEIPNGVKVTVKAKDKTEVDALRLETRDRDKDAKAKGAEGSGVLRMAHCPSAVAGAKTVVKDSKEGVIVTVTGPADKVAEIRSRAKHTADVAKKTDKPKAEHTGEGTGGGGIGRCPIVVEGDTTVDVKDVEGGVEVDVKAKKDVAALQKEAKARAASFSK